MQPEPAATAAAPGGFRPVLALWALVLFGLAFVGPVAGIIYLAVQTGGFRRNLNV